jgi:integrase/recombinase XerC
LAEEIDWGEGFSGYRNALIVQMLYFTGMRLSELIFLKDTDFDHSNLNIKVLGKRNKERLIPITPQFSSEVVKYIGLKHEVFDETSSQYLFVTDKGTRLYPNFVYRVVKSALSLITTMDKRSPHVLRHTTAMEMLQSGVAFNVIALWLGHESTATTHQYVEANLAMKEQALARLQEPDASIPRYQPPDDLRAFLEGP